jgi:hypothetical protein
VQRAELITRQDRCLRGPRGFERVDYDRDDRVELGIDGFDAVEVCLHDLYRRDLTGTDQFGQLGCVGIGDLGAHY